MKEELRHNYVWLCFGRQLFLFGIKGVKMLEKLTVISQIEVTESNIIQVRTSTRIMEDGSQLSEAYHRHCIAPGQDYSQEVAEVQAICEVVHTPDAVAAYLAQLVTA